MFTSRAFKGKTQLTRRGVLQTVNIPEELLNSVGMDFILNTETKSLDFCEGDEVFILTEKFGVSEKSDFTVFMVDGGFIINLRYGKIYLNDDENGTTYSIDEYGDVDYPRATKKIHWVDVKNFVDLAKIMTKNHFGLPNSSTVSKYIDNLGFGVVSELMTDAKRTKGTPCFYIKFADFYTDLGMNEFVFVKYNDPEYDNNEGIEASSFSDFEDEDEDDSDDLDVTDDGFEDCVSLEELESDFEDDSYDM